MGKVTSTIGRIAPVLSSAGGIFAALPTAVNAINTLTGHSESGSSNEKDIYLAQQQMALKQLQQSQQLQLRDLQEQTALSRAKIAADAAKDEQDRLSSLRRAVARQRASAGVSGISSGDASSQAILLGLYNESDEERAQRERQDAIRNTVLDQGLASQQRANILESAQLRDKQKLSRIVEGY
jgi:hypothetical protein